MARLQPRSRTHRGAFSGSGSASVRAAFDSRALLPSVATTTNGWYVEMPEELFPTPTGR